MPSPTARKAYHHGDLREAALAAAETLVDSEGSEALTLRELAKKLGVSHRALYRYFADREALLDEVAVQAMRAMHDAMTAAADAVTGSRTSNITARARVEAAVDAYIRFAFERPRAYAHMMHAGITKKAASQPLRDAGRAFGITFTTLYAAAYPEVSPANEAAITIWGTVHGLVDLYLAGTLRAKNRDVARAYIARLALTPLRRGGS
ncbi:MAG: TetR/AcrR family transcriptional regulator [Clostridia bacterium]|nr:TetR/AcrR family transcriptional regulator [Deltaproteobacteria bacterium]